MKKYTPIILTVLGMFSIGALAVYRLLQLEPMDYRLAFVLILIIYLAWMTWESRVSMDEVRNLENDYDRGTLELCAGVKIALLVTALAFKPLALSSLMRLTAESIAVLVLLCGVTLRVSAIRTMGRSYCHRIRAPRFPLITSGPYRWIRHPAYAGTLLIHTGVVLLLPNMFSVIALLLWYIAVAIRTQVENRWLLKFEPYLDYRELVPGIFIPRRAKMNAQHAQQAQS